MKQSRVHFLQHIGRSARRTVQRNRATNSTHSF
jgi:hypothetical protein